MTPPRPLGRHPGSKLHLRWPENLLQNLLGLILIIALPGSIVIMIYAIENGFFPYLVGQVSTLQIVFTSAVIALVTTCVVVWTFLVGTSLGVLSTFWFPILLTLLPSRRVRAHPLVPDDIFRRVLWTLGSLSLFALLGLSITSNLTFSQDHGPVWLAIYFLLSGFLLLGLVAVHGRRSKVDRRLVATGLFMPLALLLAVPQSIPQLTNFFMKTLGFRSSSQDLVLVDDDAHQLLEERTAFTVQGPDGCTVSSGRRTMWFLPKGIVIWRGPGNSVLIDPGQPGNSILYLRPDQVVTLPRGTASSLNGGPIAGCTRPH